MYVGVDDIVDLQPGLLRGAQVGIGFGDGIDDRSGRLASTAEEV